MNVLGLRCSNKDFTYAVVSGNKTNPVITHSSSVVVPKNFSRPRALHWMVLEIIELLRKYNVEKVVMKGSESRARGKPFVERIELETTVYVAAGMQGLNGIYKKISSTIAKDLGLKGRRRYLSTQLDTSGIEDFEKRSDSEKEAILAAWSEL